MKKEFSIQFFRPPHYPVIEYGYIKFTHTYHSKPKRTNRQKKHGKHVASLNKKKEKKRRHMF